MRVLTIDWDLEAPGLQRYFQPYLKDPALEASDGLMDFILSFANAALSSPEQAETEAWFERYADLRMVAYSVNWDGFEKRGGRLDFVPAGRQDAGYSLRVNSFNWQHFYSKLGGGIFLEEVKRRLRAEYDYVLIDSRTGVSDTSGVCTVQMPDTLVVCFTLNQQSIYGAAGTATSAVEQRRGPDNISTLRVMPVPTRVDSSEKERVDSARAQARERFERFLDWLDEDEIDEYWSDVEMPYIPFYSLEEVLAVFDKPRVRTSLLPSIEGLVSWLSEQTIVEMPALDETQRQEQMARFLRPPAPPRPRVRQERRVLFASYAHRDVDDSLRTFMNDLSQEVGTLTGLDPDSVAFFDSTLFSFGTSYLEGMREALISSSVVVCFLSPAYMNSQFGMAEYELAQQSGKQIVLIEWVPTPQTKDLMHFSGLQMYLSPSHRGGFRYLMRTDAERKAYQSSLFDIAMQITDAWRAHMAMSEASAPVRSTVINKVEKRHVLVPIVAERQRVMRLARPAARNYGLRRRDWMPFPAELAQGIGDTILSVASNLGVDTRLISLHRFREWLNQSTGASAESAAGLVIVDALTAERLEYDRELMEWNHHQQLHASAIVCVPGPDARETYRQRYLQRAGVTRRIDIVASAEELKTALERALSDLSHGL
ncbi:hypothetical protein SB822_47395 [Paraburkholderia sp. SIMBA_054]